MITIELKLFVTLSRFLPENHDAYKIPNGKTVISLMEDLEIPSEQVKLIFINGRKAEPESVLVQGDRVGLFPPVGGG